MQRQLPLVEEMECSDEMVEQMPEFAAAVGDAFDPLVCQHQEFHWSLPLLAGAHHPF